MKIKPLKIAQWLIGGTILSISGIPSFSQEAKVELEQKPLPSLPNSIDDRETVGSRINAFLRSQKLSKGENDLDGRMVLIWTGEMAISVPPSDKNFVTARNIAFQKAMLKVKEQCAKFQETRVSSEISLDLAQPGETRANADAQRLQREGLAQEGAVQVAKALNSDVKAKNAPSSIQTAGLYGEKILENKMKEELSKKGIDPNKPVADQQVKAVLNTSSFQNALRATARARCTGIQALATFEQNPSNGQGQIGVVAVWSRKLHEIADAVITGNYALIPKGQPGFPVDEHIPKDLRTKLSTYGTQLVRDEKGDYILLAFAQAQPRSKSQQSIDLAMSSARLQAEGMIRSFLGEAILSTNDMRQREESTEFEDETIQAKYDEQLSIRIKAIAEKLSIQGMQEADSWQTNHPSNNDPVVGVVVKWKASSAQLANQLKAMNQASGAKTADAVNRMNSGGSGSPNPSNSSGNTPPSRPRTSNSNSGQGAMSRDF